MVWAGIFLGFSAVAIAIAMILKPNIFQENNKDALKKRIGLIILAMVLAAIVATLVVAID